MSDALQQSIEENAAAPKRARGDSGEVEQHPLTDQIEAARFLASQKAVSGKGLGVKVSKMVSPGA
ncbi:MAG: hypothetical protein PVH19_01620 [Planctomycetia bacterium]|jgi:hypothetical protein